MSAVEAKKRFESHFTLHVIKLLKLVDSKVLVHGKVQQFDSYCLKKKVCNFSYRCK